MIHAIEVLSGKQFQEAVWCAASRNQRGGKQTTQAPRSEKDSEKDKARGREKSSDEEGELDEGLKGSFPASDPVSVTTPTRPGRPDRR